MFAKLVGDFFTEGIYDLHIGLKGYPVLPDHPPDERAHLQASDVMAGSVRTVSEHEQVRTRCKSYGRGMRCAHGMAIVASLC